MEKLRAKNDCVAWFLAIATRPFLTPYQSADLFGLFADAIDGNWRHTRELPALEEAAVIENFQRVCRSNAFNLTLRVERFRDIPYELYCERAQELLVEGCSFGVGYRSRFIFGTTGDDLHVSAVSNASPAGVQFTDHDIDASEYFAWEKIEAAAISAESGFWIVSETQ